MNLLDYMPLLHKLSNKFPYKFRDDLIQEGFIALSKSQETFDKSRNIPFQTFAYKRALGAMIDYMKSEQTTLSLDYKIDEGDSIIDLLEDDKDIDKAFENEDYYNKTLDNASRIDRFILKRYYEFNMTPSEIVEVYSELINIRDARKIKRILKI